MSEKLRQTMTEAECEALCAWLESPEGCDFQQETPVDIASMPWICDGTLKLTRQWMRAHGVNEEAIIAELEERGGYCDCEVLFNVADGRGSHRIWCINRPALSKPISGRFLVLRQSREAFSSQSEAHPSSSAGTFTQLPVT